MQMKRVVFLLSSGKVDTYRQLSAHLTINVIFFTNVNKSKTGTSPVSSFACPYHTSS